MDITAILEEHAHHFLQGIKAEYDGDKEAAAIIHKYLKGGKISDEEDRGVKTQ